MTHLRRSLHSSAFVKGCPLLATWDLQVMSLPVKFLLSTSCSCPALPQTPGVTEGTSRVASAHLPVPCHHPGMLGWALLSGEDVWDRLTGLLPSLPSDQPGPAHALEFGSFTLFSGRTWGSLPFYPPSLPLTGVHGATNKETTPDSPLRALSKRSRALGQGRAKPGKVSLERGEPSPGGGRPGLLGANCPLGAPRSWHRAGGRGEGLSGRSTAHDGTIWHCFSALRPGRGRSCLCTVIWFAPAAQFSAQGGASAPTTATMPTDYVRRHSSPGHVSPSLAISFYPLASSRHCSRSVLPPPQLQSVPQGRTLQRPKPGVA